VKEVVNGIRNVRAVKNIPNKDKLTVNVIGTWNKTQDAAICKLANCETINHDAEKNPAAASFIVGVTEVNIPLEGSIDKDAEIAKLKKDLEYMVGFKTSVLKKLSNERFVNNAPEAVVEAERRKLNDAEAKISNLEKAIEALS
ncbi:MAG: valine--tRNA ligase, partial [Paramuribaculum sp.]|nr:valine--tRNA ligase [Paramuribaculum sp.]